MKSKLILGVLCAVTIGLFSACAPKDPTVKTISANYLIRVNGKLSGSSGYLEYKPLYYVEGNDTFIVDTGPLFYPATGLLVKPQSKAVIVPSNVTIRCEVLATPMNIEIKQSFSAEYEETVKRYQDILATGTYDGHELMQLTCDPES